MQDNPVGKIDLKIATLDLDDEGESKTEYYAGETIGAYATIEPSGNGLKIINPTLKITFPRSFVETQPPFPKPESAKSLKITTDSNNWYATYSFDQLVGGKRIDIPLSFKMRSNTYGGYSTPDGFEKEIKMELFNEEGELIADTSTIYTNKNYDNAIGNYTAIEGMSLHWKGSQDDVGDAIWTGTIPVYHGDTSLMPEGAGAPRFLQNISIVATGDNIKSSPVGRYLPKSVKISVQLEDGVLPGILQTEGQYSGLYMSNYSRIKAYWNFDEDKNIATYSGSLIWQGIVPLRTYYPNLPYKDSDGKIKIYKSTITLTQDPDTPYEKTLAPVTRGVGWGTKLENSDNYLAFAKMGYNHHNGISYEKPEYEKDLPYSYYISVRDGRAGDTGRQNFNLYELLDYDLDPKLYYKAIKLEQRDNISTPKKFTIYGIKEDNSEEKLAENLEKGTYFSINDTSRQYKNLKIVFDEPLLLNSSILNFHILTAIRDESRAEIESDFLVDKKVENWQSVELGKKQLKNFVKLTYSKAETPTQKKERITQGRIYYVKDYATLVSWRNSSETLTVPYSLNNKRTLVYSSYLYKDIDWTEYGKQNIIAKGVKFLFLLPSGIEYVAGSTRFGNPASLSIMSGLTLSEPQVVNNYQNSGKTALIYDLGDIKRGREFVDRNYYSKRINSRLTFDIEVTKYARLGSNVIEAYEIGDRSKDRDIFPGSTNKEVSDTLDYDNDGDNSDTIRVIGPTTINFVPAREIILRNTISNKVASDFANGSIFDQDEAAHYKFSIFNNALIPASDLSIISVLPAIGDHAIVADKNGEYLPRNSQFNVGLSQSLESVSENKNLLNDWQILYSLESQGEDIEATKNAKFVPADQIGDFTKVKMIKILQKPGSKLKEGATADFVFPVYVPNKDTQGKLLTAVGSSAFSTDGYNYIEGNQTKYQLVNDYRIDGKVFADSNKDGAMIGETGLSGYTVNLMNADGTPAMDAKGNKITTQTDQEGNYEMKILRRGQYYLTINKKVVTDRETKLYEEGGLIIPGSGGNDAVLDGDDSTEMTLKSSSFHLNPFSISSPEKVLLKPSSMVATRNFGLILSNGKIMINVMDNEDETKGLSGAVFLIEDKNGASIGSFVSDKNGNIQTDFLPFGEYMITQKEASKDYDVNSERIKINVDKALSSIVIKNKKSKGSLTFLAFDQNDHNIPMAGVVFEIKNAKGEVLEVVTTDSAGRATTKSYVYGEYFVKEILAPAEYQLASPMVTPIKISNPSTKVSLPYLRKTATIAIKKTNMNGSRNLSGAVFEISKGGGLVDTIASDQNGNAISQKLPWGIYHVKEASAPRGYYLSKEIREVNLSGDSVHLIIKNKKKSNPILSGDPIVSPSPNLPVLGTGEVISTGVTIEIINTGDNVIIDEEQNKNQEYTPPISQKEEPDPIMYRELLKKEASVQVNKIKKYVKVLPKTGVGYAETLIKRAGIISKVAKKRIETSLPGENTFRLAGNKTVSLQERIQLLPRQDRNAEKYLILPTQGLIIPINTVGEDTQSYRNFTNGIAEDFVPYLRNGAVELPGTSINSYGASGNKVVIGHSSYRKNSAGRYKTHFQKIIAMEPGEEVRVYQRDPRTKKYDKFSYKVIESYNTKPDDTSVLYPSNLDQITLITCTPIGGIAGRWVVKAVATKK